MSNPTYSVIVDGKDLTLSQAGDLVRAATKSKEKNAPEARGTAIIYDSNRTLSSSQTKTLSKSNGGKNGK